MTDSALVLSYLISLTLANERWFLTFLIGVRMLRSIFIWKNINILILELVIRMSITIIHMQQLLISYLSSLLKMPMFEVSFDLS